MGQQAGLSIRLMREWKPDDWRDRNGVSWDTVFLLAMQDERDIPFPRKWADAHAFIKSRTH